MLGGSSMYPRCFSGMDPPVGSEAQARISGGCPPAAAVRSRVARGHDAKERASLDVLEREVHQMGSGIDRDGVRVRHRDSTFESETAVVLGEHGDLAGFRRGVQLAPLGLARRGGGGPGRW